MARPGRGTRSTRRVPFILFSLVVVAAMVLALASAQALVAQGSFKLTELGREAEQLERDQARLELKLARLSSPERVLRAARRAGLVLRQEFEILPVRGNTGPSVVEGPTAGERVLGEG